MSVPTSQRINLKAWLRLVRWPNLLIIALTQLVAWWYVVFPLQGPHVLTPRNFFFLCISALLLAGIVALPAGHPEWLLLQLAWTAMLWRYSTTWKRQFMIGNVVVSLMTALTIVALIIYEPLVFAPKPVVLDEH